MFTSMYQIFPILVVLYTYLFKLHTFRQPADLSDGQIGYILCGLISAWEAGSFWLNESLVWRAPLWPRYLLSILLVSPNKTMIFLAGYWSYVMAPLHTEAISGGWRGPSRHPLSVSGGGDATPWPFIGVSTPLNLERWGEPNLRKKFKRRTRKRIKNIYILCISL